MANIIVSPEFEKIKDEVVKLKDELSKAILELDELRYVICKNIEKDYMLELGDLEYKVFKAECTYLRCKRKLEMIQAKLNREENIDLDLIEKQLNAEFVEYMQEIKKRLDSLNEAIRLSKCGVLNDSESREIKKLYRYIVKKLHPDMNPKITDEYIRLFQNAIDAYKTGDLKTIRLIYRLIVDERLDTDLSFYDYEDIKDNLIKNINDVNLAINDIKSVFPYNVKEILEDKDEINKRRNDFNNELNSYIESTKTINERINELIIQYENKEARKWAS